MARTPASFTRSKPLFKQQPKVLVICEDSKSGKRYLEDASLHFRVNVLVEISHCGKSDPIGIVNEGKHRAKKIDQVFCVIDRDTHPGFDQAQASVKDHEKVKVIASYPCFEFWLLLHFGYTRKPYFMAGKHSAADLLIKDLRSKPGFENYDKGKDISIFSLLGNQFTEARRIAPKILDEAIGSGEMNPSTRLHELIDIFENLSLPQKIA